MREQGEDMYRMKGVLAIAHAKQRFVYHAVHMILSGNFTEEWGEGEARESKLVFIGKNIDAEALAASFNKSLSTPENEQTKRERLRFEIGDKVECRTGCHEWSRGEVVAFLCAARDSNVQPMRPATTAIYVHILFAGTATTRCRPAWSRRTKCVSKATAARARRVASSGCPRTSMSWSACRSGPIHRTRLIVCPLTPLPFLCMPIFLSIPPLR
jgi:hypothetical protein